MYLNTQSYTSKDGNVPYIMEPYFEPMIELNLNQKSRKPETLGVAVL